jgi:hypothetical protein
MELSREAGVIQCYPVSPLEYPKQTVHIGIAVISHPLEFVIVIVEADVQ